MKTSLSFLAAASALAMCTAAAADQPALSEADFRCLERAAAVAPTLNLAINSVAAHCRVAPTAAVTSWLSGTPLVRDMSRALAQRIEAGLRGSALPADAQAMPRVSQRTCEALAEVAAATQRPLCTIAGAGVETDLQAAQLEALSARCEVALMSLLGVRVLPLTTAPDVVDITPSAVTCTTTAEVIAAGSLPLWRQLRVTLDLAAAETRSLDMWPAPAAGHRAP